MPVGKKVRVLVTAADVIHAWWIPAFGAKQDAIPGFLRDTWFRADKPGTYRGQCMELCGKEHGFMPIVVRVVSAEDYSKWVGERKKTMAAAADDPSKVWTPDELKARGEKVYAANCVACHQATGQGHAARVPGARRVQGRERARSSAQIDTVLNGKPNTAMQAFGKQLSDTDLAAVITYTRNILGQQGGEVSSPPKSRPKKEITHERSRTRRPRARSRRTCPRAWRPPRRLQRHHALDHHHQPQGHRHAVPVVQLHHVHGRRR